MILKNKKRLFHYISTPSDWWLTFVAKWLLFIPLTFTLQTQITFFEIPFNFAILIVYIFVLQMHSRIKKEEFPAGKLEIKSTIFGASIGILDDIISGTIIGPSFLSKGLTGFIIAVLFGSIFFRWTFLLGIIVVFIITLFDGIVQIIIRLIFSEIRIDLFDGFQIILIQALINLPLGLLLRPSESK